MGAKVRHVAAAKLRGACVGAVSEIAEYLKLYLPDAMLLDPIEFLPGQPWTPSGKLDHAAPTARQAPSYKVIAQLWARF